MDSVCVTIQWGEILAGEEEPQYNVQYHGNVIPQKGCSFSFWTSRDRDGNYREGTGNEGDIRELVTGTVSNVDYLYEVWGKDSNYNRQTMYVRVTLANWKMGDA